MAHNSESTNAARPKRRTDWAGVFVVAVTPFAEDGGFDENAIRRMVDVYVDDGVDGIVLAGSTGEWYGMSDTERIDLFRIAADQNRGRVKLLAGTSAIATASAVTLTAAAREIGCDGAMLLPPPYVMPSNRELVAYFRAVDEVGLPMMLYNNPTRTGVNLDVAHLSMLMPLRNVVALKDSVKDIAQLGATLRRFRDELAIFVGFESYVGPCVQRGAVGVVAMAANVLGRRAGELFRLAQAGDWNGVSKIQDKIDLLYEWMYGRGHNPYVVVKEAMRILGRPGGWPRPPLLSLEQAQRDELARFMREVIGGSEHAK